MSTQHSSCVYFILGSRSKRDYIEVSSSDPRKSRFFASSSPGAKVFVLPEEKDALICEITTNTSYVRPTCSYVKTNLELLTRHVGKSWCYQVFSKQIEDSPLSHVDVILGLAQIFKLDDVKACALNKVKVERNKINIQTEDREKEMLEATMKAMEEENKVGAKTLTTIALKDQTCANVVQNLGTVYDVYQMMESESYSATETKLIVHNAIVTVLQNYGMNKIGLEGQDYFTEKNKKLWSKSTIASLIKKNSERILNTLYSSLQRISTESLVPVMKLLDDVLNSKIKVNEGTWSKLAGYIHDCLLVKSDFISANSAVLKYKDIKSKSIYKLDPWQSEMIQHIMDGRSVLTVGPTSAGKTFASMAALEWLFKNRKDINLAYIAPNFYQAFQAYSNIVKTFPSQKVSLVTGSINTTFKDSKIWVGTPCELWAYLLSTKETFTIGIFDEVHTLSVSYGDDIGSRMRSEALSNLLELCNKQIIALSATIHDEDIPRISSFLSSKTGIKDISTVVYRERPIALKHQIYTSEGLSESDGDIDEEVEVNEVETFQMLKQMSNRDMFPALIFDESDEKSYEGFINLVSWLEENNNQHYSNWNSLYSKCEDLVNDYNNESSDIYNIYCSSSDKHNIDMIQRSIKQMQVKRQNTAIKVLEEMVKSTRNAMIVNYDEDGNPDKYMADDVPDKLVKLYDIYNSRFESEVEYNINYTVEAVDIIREMEIYHHIVSKPSLSGPESISPLPYVCKGVGSLFKISECTSDLKMFKSAKNLEHDGEAWKAYKLIRDLCEAESVRMDDVSKIFSLIDRALEFGVGIILPTMPFAVQYQMLLLLQKKRLKVVFASHSMSMGINYPIRTSVIRSNQLRDVNVCQYMQMAGRAGRRGFDVGSGAYVVSWNVKNAPTASLKTLPFIDFPTSQNGGLLIPDYVQVVREIEQTRISMGNHDALVEASRSILKSNNKLSRGFNIDIGDVSKEDVDAIEDDPDELVVKAKVNKAVIDDTAVLTAVIGSVGPVGKALGMGVEEVATLIERIKHIALNTASTEHMVDCFTWSSKIDLVASGLQELHTRLHRRKCTDLLDFIAKCFELVHRVSFRQISIS